jgi:hypothetical protein
MGGGQAGAPADDDHVPWSRPPGMATMTSPVTARAGAGQGWAGLYPGIGAGLGPNPARKANSEGQGRSRQSGGAEKICQRAATITMLRTKNKSTCQTKRKNLKSLRKSRRPKANRKPARPVAMPCGRW